MDMFFNEDEGVSRVFANLLGMNTQGGIYEVRMFSGKLKCSLAGIQIHAYPNNGFNTDITCVSDHRINVLDFFKMSMGVDKLQFSVLHFNRGSIV
jgi:hypothetical protein